MHLHTGVVSFSCAQPVFLNSRVPPRGGAGGWMASGPSAPNVFSKIPNLLGLLSLSKCSFSTHYAELFQLVARKSLKSEIPLT